MHPYLSVLAGVCTAVRECRCRELYIKLNSELKTGCLCEKRFDYSINWVSSCHLLTVKGSSHLCIHLMPQPRGCDHGMRTYWPSEPKDTMPSSPQLSPAVMQENSETHHPTLNINCDIFVVPSVLVLGLVIYLYLFHAQVVESPLQPTMHVKGALIKTSLTLKMLFGQVLSKLNPIYLFMPVLLRNRPSSTA